MPLARSERRQSPQARRIAAGKPLLTRQNAATGRWLRMGGPAHGAATEAAPGRHEDVTRTARKQVLCPDCGVPRTAPRFDTGRPLCAMLWQVLNFTDRRQDLPPAYRPALRNGLSLEGLESLMAKPQTLIASHRGGAILWPENSPTAFRQTARLAVEQVELDAHLSADDAVVVIHDATLDRTTEASGPVRAQSLAALRQTRLKGTDGEVVPTLAEVAAIFRGTPIGLRLELKRDAQGKAYPGLLPRVVAVLEEAGMLARTTITSFAAPLAGAAARHGGFAGAIWLVSLACWRDLGAEGVGAVAQGWKLGAVGLHHSICDASAMQVLGESGLAVGAWAVNDAAAMRRMLALGVVAFTTDDPVTALALRGA